MEPNTSLSFNDIIKKGVLDQVNQLSPTKVIIALLLAFAIGLFILFIYKKTFAGVLYSRSYGLSLVMVTLVTTLVMLPITSNVALSLGMVGALSIVRFRTAVKDAMDTMFMFWGIAIGVCLAGNFWQVALIGSLIIGLVMVLLTSLKLKSSMPYLLVVHFHDAANPEVRRQLSRIKTKIKSKTLRGNTVELSLEVRIRPGEDAIVNELMRVEGVYDASLLSYHGEVVS